MERNCEAEVNNLDLDLKRGTGSPGRGRWSVVGKVVLGSWPSVVVGDGL